MHLPGFDTAYNTRLIVVATLALALLAGMGLGDLIERVRAAAAAARRRAGGVRRADRRGAARARVLGALRRRARGRVGVGGAAADARRRRRAAVRRGLGVAVLGGAAVGAARAARRPAGSPAARSRRAALVLVVLDLFRIGMGNNPAIPVDHAEQPVTPRDRAAAGRRGRRASPGCSRPIGLQPLVPDLAMRYGLYDARGYDYPGRAPLRPDVAAYDQRRRRSSRRRRSRWSRRPVALRLLGLLGVTDLLAPPGPERAGAARDLRRPGRAASTPTREAMPRTWVVGGQRAWTATTPRSRRSPHPASTRAARRSSRSRSRAGGRAGAHRGRVADRVVRAPTGSSSTCAPTAAASSCSPTCTSRAGRRPSTAARPPIERVDYLLRGVAVGAGEHRDRDDVRAVELADRVDRRACSPRSVLRPRCGRVRGRWRSFERG